MSVHSTRVQNDLETQVKRSFTRQMKSLSAILIGNSYPSLFQVILGQQVIKSSTNFKIKLNGLHRDHPPPYKFKHRHLFTTFSSTSFSPRNESVKRCDTIVITNEWAAAVTLTSILLRYLEFIKV